MFDHFMDNLIARLMAGAGLVMAAAIAAVAAAMAIFAFVSLWVGPAWAYTIVSVTAAGIMAIWSLLQRHARKKTRQPALEQQVLDTLYAHPTAAFLTGVAAATLFKGKPSLAARLWNARKNIDLTN